MSMRPVWILAVLCGVAGGLSAGCGGAEETEAIGTSEEELIVALTLDGRVTAMTTPVAGAWVQAFDATGKRIGRAATNALGSYSLPLPARPARLVVTSVNHAPRALQSPPLTLVNKRAKVDVDLGPWLGGDFIQENRAYFVTRSTTAPKLVRTVSWGFGGGLGSPWDETGDLVAGPRQVRLTSLLPAGTKVVPNLEAAVTEVSSARGKYLEARFSEELDRYNLGSEFTGLLFQQIVSTVSHADGRGLPVRIRVRCATCTGGYKDIKDGVIGATGPNNSYKPATAAPVPAFGDLAGQRYADHVTMAKAMGLLPDSDARATTFRPDAPATRAFLAELLVRALGLTLLAPTTARFTDVPGTHPSFRAIETAAQSGALTSATSAFRPAGTFTRAELAGFVANAAKWPSWNPPNPTFTDVPKTYWGFGRIETAHGYCRAVEQRGNWSVTDFQPAAFATRAEAVAAVTRMMNCFTGAEIGAR